MSPFVQNVLKLVSGNVVAQLIIVGTMPLVTRLYSPGDFGFFSVIVSILLIVGPVSNLRFSPTVLLAKDQSESMNLLALSCFSSLGVSLVLAGLIALYACDLLPLSLPDLERARHYLWIIPLGVLLFGTLNSASSWAIRHEKFRELAVTNVVKAISSRIFVLLTGLLFPLGAWGLIIGRLLGLGSALTYISRSSSKNLASELWETCSLREMKRLGRRFKDFPLYGTWATILATVSTHLPVILLAALFSPITSGYYALCTRMIRLPMNIIGESMQRVFLQRAVSLRKERKKLAQETIRMVTWLVYLTLPLMLILVFLGDRIFGWVFGNEWAESGVYAQILAPSFLFLFLSIPLRALYVVFERQKERLVYGLISFVARAGVLVVVAFLTLLPRVTLLAMSIATCLIVMGLFLYFFRLLDVRSSLLLRICVKLALVMSPLVMGLVVIKFYLGSDVLTSTMVIVLSLFIQIIAILVAEPALMQRTKTYWRP
jgi:O-antigen/teichoic acid export membrane protein